MLCNEYGKLAKLHVEGKSAKYMSAILVTSAIFTAVKSTPMGVPFEVGLSEPEITLPTLLTILGVPRDISATATI